MLSIYVFQSNQIIPMLAINEQSFTLNYVQGHFHEYATKFYAFIINDPNFPNHASSNMDISCTCMFTPHVSLFHGFSLATYTSKRCYNHGMTAQVLVLHDDSFNNLQIIKSFPFCKNTKKNITFRWLFLTIFLTINSNLDMYLMLTDDNRYEVTVCGRCYKVPHHSPVHKRIEGMDSKRIV